MDRKRERRDHLIDGELRDLIEKGAIAKSQLEIVEPLLDKLKQVIHDKWERNPITDNETDRVLKYQLHAVNELRRALQIDINGAEGALIRAEKNHGKH